MLTTLNKDNESYSDYIWNMLIDLEHRKSSIGNYVWNAVGRPVDREVFGPVPIEIERQTRKGLYKYAY